MTARRVISHRTRTTVPLEIQRQYIAYHAHHPRKVSEIVLLKESKKLFSAKINAQEKKKLLFALANLGTLKGYRILQRYEKSADQELKAWTELCLQDGAAHLSREIMDADMVMVSGGVGGDGQRLRFFLIFSISSRKIASTVQQGIIQRTTKVTDETLDSRTESLKFGKGYCLVSVLLPFSVSPEQYFQSMYHGCNRSQPVLCSHYFCTNTFKPQTKDIASYLRSSQT